MPGKLKIVVSDFHLADGQEEGRLNPWENFHHDDKFAELLRHYSTDFYEDEEVELIINGDFFDLLQVRYDGGFPVDITESIGVAKLKAALDGHPVTVAAMRAFVDMPHKSIAVIPGNHDFELIFPRCHRLFREYVCGDADDPRVKFITDRPFYEFDGVQVHHGMQFEGMNRFNWKRLLIPRKGQEPVLNQPWGSIFLLTVLNHVKEKRPYVDKVAPFSLYFIGALFFDTRIALQLAYLSLLSFWKTRILPLFKRPRTVSVSETLSAIFSFTAFPNFERQIKKLLKKNPRIHTVIMGHTHLAKMRRFGHNKTYVNTGTWTDLISLDISQLGHSRDLTYCTIEYPEDELPRAKLRAWRGYHDLYQDIYY